MMNTKNYPPEFTAIFTSALLSGNEAKIEACEAYASTGQTYDDQMALVESIRGIDYDRVIPTMLGTNQDETPEINFQVTQRYLPEEDTSDEGEMPELVHETEEDRRNFGTLSERYHLPFTINPADCETNLTVVDLQSLSDGKVYFQPDPLKENCFTLEHSSDAHNFFKTRLTSGDAYFEDDENRCGGRFIAGTSDTIEEKEEIITTNVGGFLVTDTISNCEALARMSGKYHYEVDSEVMKRFILQSVGKSGDEIPELESRRV